MTTFSNDRTIMCRALDLARQGEGLVEPNPMVGAVVVDENRELLGEGYHQRFGGPHAEVHALRAAGEAARGATLFVTLEPCSHQGQTPPCADAVIAAGIRRVVVAAGDPFPEVSGRGFARLRAAGIRVETGLCEAEAIGLTRPFRMLVTSGRPYVHAKWAMTLDGKIATRTGASQWISNAASRAKVHTLRGRMDGILVGIGTALADDPLLTARPAGPRVATRIVLDALARLPVESKLAKTARDIPVILFTSTAAPTERTSALRAAGVEVVVVPDTEVNGGTATLDLAHVLADLGRRRMTNVLVEGGGQVLGSLADQDLIDHLHVFIAPRLIGGASAPGPIGGLGPGTLPDALPGLVCEVLDGDVYWHGEVGAMPRSPTS